MAKTVSTQHEMFALLIVKQRLVTLAGVDFCLICLPVTAVYLQWLYQQSEVFQMALTDFSGQLSTHPPKHKLVAAGFNLLTTQKKQNSLTSFYGWVWSQPQICDVVVEFESQPM